MRLLSLSALLLLGVSVATATNSTALPTTTGGKKVTLYNIQADIGLCQQDTLSANDVSAYVDMVEDMGETLTEGTCPSQGYTNSVGSGSETLPGLEDIVVTESFRKPRRLLAQTATLHGIRYNFLCMQHTIDSKYVDVLKEEVWNAVQVTMVSGTCASEGFSKSSGDAKVVDDPKLGGKDVVELFTKG